jgi:hypothetical protein
LNGRPDDSLRVPTLTEVVELPGVPPPEQPPEPAADTERMHTASVEVVQVATPAPTAHPIVAPSLPTPARATEAATHPAAAPLAAALPSRPLPTDEQLVQSVLTDLQRQIDLMLDYRLREAIAPALTRAADALVREMRADLASTLRDVVARAVAQELARHRQR